MSREVLLDRVRQGVYICERVAELQLNYFAKNKHTVENTGIIDRQEMIRKWRKTGRSDCEMSMTGLAVSIEILSDVVGLWEGAPRRMSSRMG